MALTPYKTFAPGEILTAADLNASFSHLTTNALQMISPLTGTLDADGQIIVLDSDADSKIQCAADDVLTLTLQNFGAFIWDGDVASPVNGITFTSSATGVAPSIIAHGETNVSLEIGPKGTGDLNLRAGGSETDLLVQASGSEANIDLRFQGKGTGKVKLGDADLEWPDADGSAGESLVTDGSGVLSFAPSFAAADRLIFQQTTPSGNWVKDTAITTNSALRLITGTVANDLTGSGFTTIFATGRTTSTESAGHTHAGTTGTSNTPTVLDVGGAGNAVTPDHTHNFTTGAVSANHTHSTDMKVDYYDAVIGEAA
ncbi:MAG: hypothetical protein AB7Q01_15000 [Gammaproteobacteria bacterium]